MKVLKNKKIIKREKITKKKLYKVETDSEKEDEIFPNGESSEKESKTIVYKKLRKDEEKENKQNKKNIIFFLIPQWRLKDIGDDVHIGHTVTPFKSIGKSGALDKTASHFDNANLKVKIIKALFNAGIMMQILPTTFQEPWIWFVKNDRKNKNHWATYWHSI